MSDFLSRGVDVYSPHYPRWQQRRRSPVVEYGHGMDPQDGCPFLLRSLEGYRRMAAPSWFRPHGEQMRGLQSLGLLYLGRDRADQAIARFALLHHNPLPVSATTSQKTS